MHSRRLRRLWSVYGGYALGFVSLFLIWQLASVYVVSSVLFPPPTVVFRKGVLLVRNGVLLEHLSASLQRIMAGFMAGSLLGIPIGLAMGSFRPVRKLLEPYTEFLRFIPSVAMITVAVIWFGIGEASKIFLIIYTTIFIVILNTAAGVSAIAPDKIRAAQSLGATRAQIFFHVAMPATVPYILTGMRLAMGNSFTTIVAAELIAANDGLGKMLWAGRLFKKHGLDVRINTGPSGSAMVSFLINGQIESAFGSEIAGVSNHNLDPNVVVVAQATRLVRWIAVVGRNVDNLDQLKGKKVGVARGSGGEVFWLAMLDKLKLNAADYTVVNVEAPEMVAALERGNIDAYAVWEPWVSRGLAAVKNTKVLKDQEGILEQGVYIYMNLGWIRKNPAQAESFMRALVEATDIINKDRKRAAKDVSDFLKNLDPPLVEQLMTKLTFDIELGNSTIGMFRLAEAQLKQQGKLSKPLDSGAFVYPDLLRKVQPVKVNYKP